MKDLLTIKEIGHNPVFVFYLKKTPHKGYTSLKFLNGIVTNKNRVIHRNIGLNQFLREEIEIPKGFYKKRKIPDKNWLKTNFYDPSRTPIQKKEVPELKADINGMIFLIMEVHHSLYI